VRKRREPSVSTRGAFKRGRSQPGREKSSLSVLPADRPERPGFRISRFHPGENARPGARAQPLAACGPAREDLILTGKARWSQENRIGIEFQTPIDIGADGGVALKHGVSQESGKPRLWRQAG